MTANIAFALCAAVLSLVVVVLAGLKGDWWVVGVYAVLAAGFLARARFGRRASAEPRGRGAARRRDHEATGGCAERGSVAAERSGGRGGQAAAPRRCARLRGDGRATTSTARSRSSPAARAGSASAPPAR